MQKSIFLVFVGILLINFVTAQFTYDKHINLQLKDASDNIITGTFNFQFNVTTKSDCTDIVYNKSASLTTDKDGIVSYYLPNVTLPYNQTYWLCIYRNNNLDSSNKIASVPYAERARNVTISGIIIDTNLNMTDKNISTTGTGFFSFIGSLTNLVSKIWANVINVNSLIVNTEINLSSGAKINDNESNSYMRYDNGRLIIVGKR